MKEKEPLFRCLWCNQLKKKEELNVIYGKNNFFDKSIFYGCKLNHINKIKKYLELTQKNYKNTFFSLIISLILYPIFLMIFEKQRFWICLLLALDFALSIFFFPFSTPEFTEKIGIKNNIIFLKSLSIIILITIIIIFFNFK